MNDCVPLGGSMSTVHLLLEYSCLVVYEGSRGSMRRSRGVVQSPPRHFRLKLSSLILIRKSQVDRRSTTCKLRVFVCTLRCLRTYVWMLF